MSPTPPSSGSSHSPEGQYRVVRKRNRVPLSCAPCRNKKLKCNRAVPCENCVKRGDAPSCTYAQATNRKRYQSQPSPSTPVDMQNRIDRLESLVLSLMTNGSQSGGPAAAMAALSQGGSAESRPDLDGDGDEMNAGEEESDTEQVTRSLGIMKFDSKDQKSFYISQVHWASILNDISEVKQFFVTHKAQYDEQMQNAEARREERGSGSALIFEVTKPLSKSEILASFPSKYIADILVSRFFKTYDPSINLIHYPAFRKEYEAHWQDPSKSSIVWIGMVFAMMRLTMLSFHGRGDEPPEFRGKSLDMAAGYRNSMAQCLVLADYTKPHKYLIETMILHLQAEYIQSREAETSVWVLVGVIVRLAMRMGYHRDSRLFNNISVFQGEMRRRIWAFIRQADHLFSFQVGLPGMIRSGDCDTENPHNLYDEDFDEDCTELPPERPLSEPTPVSYIIAKCRLAYAFGRVLEYSQKLKGSSYEEIMAIDSELRRACDMIPEHLQVKPMSQCHDDPPYLIIARFGIMSIYHKAQCVLHRPFLNHARDNPRYMTSRRTCVESSLELLRFQAMQHEESRPGGLLEGRDWFASSLSSQDYLLASTILALDLYHEFQMQAAGRGSNNTYGWGFNRQEEMIAALRRSRDIWNELKDRSMDAWKAANLLGVLLEKVGQGSHTTKDGHLRDVPDEKQSAAMTLGLLSTGLTPGRTSPPPHFPDPMKLAPNPPAQANPSVLDQGAFPASSFGLFGQMPDMQPFDLDWDAWDSYIQSGGLDPTAQDWSMLDLQQFPASPMAQAQAQAQAQARPENGVHPNERPGFPAVNPQANVFGSTVPGFPADNSFADPNGHPQGRRPGQM